MTLAKAIDLREVEVNTDPRSRHGIDGMYVIDEQGCWIWQGTLEHHGYGQLRRHGRRMKAHRYAYALHIGPVPAGATVDHLCFQPSCVNPAHLQLLSHAENCSRKQSLTAETCARGHLWTEENTGLCPRGHRTERYCRTCRRMKKKGEI